MSLRIFSSFHVYSNFVVFRYEFGLSLLHDNSMWIRSNIWTLLLTSILMEDSYRAQNPVFHRNRNLWYPCEAWSSFLFGRSKRFVGRLTRQLQQRVYYTTCGNTIGILNPVIHENLCSRFRLVKESYQKFSYLGGIMRQLKTWSINKKIVLQVK